MDKCRAHVSWLKIIATFEDSNAPHKRRRLVVLQRKDGYFSLGEEYHYRSEYEGKVVAEGWARLPPEGLFETIEIATAEALSSGRLGPSRDDT
jgi:hypothetical protein